MPTNSYVVGTGEGAHFVTLNDALQKATDGDVISLQPGLYEELVKVTASVVITAVEPTSEEDDTETTIGNDVIILASATLTNIQIRGRVDIRKGHAVIEGCDIHHGRDGVRVGPESKLTLKASRVHHCTASGDGVYFMANSAGEIEDTDIYECRVNGVHVHNSSVALRNNRIRDCCFGIYYRGPSTGLVENNSLEHVAKFGLYVTESSDPVIRANRVRECGIHCVMVSQGGKGLWTDNDLEGSVHVLKGCEAKLGENRISGTADISSSVPVGVA